MGPQQILAVDDNSDLLYLVEATLEQAGFEVITASSGQEAVILIERRGLPHLALIDVNMPGMNGFELVDFIRESSDLPVIFLTVVDNDDTVIKAIEQYADDYVIKPFDADELVARVQRVLRRVDSFDYRVRPVIEIDDHLQINPANQEVIVAGEAVPLTPTEAKLLDTLVKNRGRVVTIERLIQRIWPLEEASKDRLYVAIYRLRQKLKGETGDWDYIFTESGLGYVFRAVKD